MSGIYWGAGREMWYSETRRCIGGIGALGACRVLGPLGGVGVSWVYLGLAGNVGTQELEGV